ncbi:DUF6297 family protein [Gordonia sp. HY002]|uniref:DUF6297 family protein n=1 Tax=Gordonia zhenghanii TaxID=2911516 RepID=UPI001EEF7F0D|nr:DUF6297 family protein [Gordonia zhenghanii]MCF8569317.1 DUF6297 family protein [Gordonia zhenghanii]MCF8606671.1 DUF6297 family protein [Gordonia zhenghanii]
MRRRENWLRRNNVSAVDLLLMVGVGGGLAVAVFKPTNVAKFVEPSAMFDDYQVAVIAAFATMTALVVGRFAVTWGPVRVDRAVLKWELSGPASRHRPLIRRLAVTVGCAVMADVAIHGALALLIPESATILLALGVGLGFAAVCAAYIAQLVRDRRMGASGVPGFARLSPGRLHQRTFAPRDGFAAAVGLGISMMDASWIADARITRWQRQTGSKSRGHPRTAEGAFVRMDLRRLRRHPEAAARWTCWTAVGIAVPVFVDFHAVPLFVATLAVWSAGVATAGGLTSVSDRVLARSFGVSDRDLRRWHCVVPTIATLVSATAVAAASSVSLFGSAFLIVGTVASVLRRATRPPLPFDAPMVIEPLMTGAAFQPALLSTQLRGLLLAAVVGVIAGALP